MFTQSFQLIRLQCAGGVAFVALCFALFMFQASFASAQAAPQLTATQLQELISQLRAQLTLLNSSVGTTSAAFATGMTVEITDTIRVRNAANIEAKLVGVQNPGTKGVIVDGPIRQGGFNWVKVDYETGADGWNVSSWLRKKADFAGELPVVATCSYEGKKYKKGDVVTMSLSTSTAVSTKKITAGTAKYECAGERWRLEDSESSQTYVYADTESITKRYIDPSVAMADEEYTLYTIILKSGRKISVKIFGRTVLGTTEEAFRKTGFVGDVTYLMNRAKELPAETKVPEPSSAPQPTPAPTTTPRVKLPQETTGGCVSGTTTYSVGDTRQTIVVAGQTRVVADASFVCRAGKWVIEGSLPKNPFSYSLSEVKSVTFKEINAEPIKKGSGVLLSNKTERVYTITLKNSRVITVREQLSSGSSENDPFKKSGYVGNSTKLKAMATIVPVVKGAATDIWSEISTTLTTIKNILSDIK